MKNRRDILIIVGLFLALILFVAFGPGLRPSNSGPSGATTHSSDEDGALAFYNWTRALGYDALRLEYRAFALDERDAALVILNPQERIDRSQSRAMIDWVERGGTLIFAEDNSALFSPANALLDELDVQTTIYSTTTTLPSAAPAQPALDQPPFKQAPVQTARKLVLRTND